VLERFMERHHESGFFIRKRCELEASTEEWMKLISKTHDREATTSNDQYEIVFFRSKDPK
jgi:hypothetical protein